MKRISLAAIFLLFHSLPAISEESAGEQVDAQDRPRVGLVLSGGGARGAAHIGILKFLEEQNIPVDYVAGTSMGAVVGGLYASGMTAEEIETMTRAIDWGAMFRDDLSPAELPIRRKVEGYQYLVDVEAGYRDGQIVFPTGFLRGQRLNLLLRKHMLPVRHIRNFDELPTPFRAVATDLANARAVTFREGDIVTAMRASMSVPGVFNPVEYEGTKLVDGGLVENLPIPTAREFKPDILIVVDVTTPLDNVHSLASPFEVTSQVIDGIMLIQSRRLRKEMEPDDLLVLPQLGGYTSASFDDIGDIIDRGYAAARAQGEQLRRLSVPEPVYADYAAERRSKRLPHPFIADIVVDDKGMGLERLVKARIGQREESTLDVESLENDLQELYGLQLFDIADYEIEPISREAGDEGRAVDQLVIKTQPKETGPLRFELGFELVENFEGDTAFELSAATKVTNLNALGAEWRTEFGLGELTGMTTEFYQPVDFDGRFFVSTHYTNGLARILRADPSGAIAEYSAHLNQLGLDLGWNLTEFSALRVGVRTGTLSTTLEQGDPAVFADQDFDIGDLVLGFRHDSMDSFSFPSEGSWVDVRWEKSKGELGADEDGEFVSVDALKAVNWFKDNLLVGISAQSVVSGNRFEAVGVRLGGFTQLSGFERDELVGQHSLLARAIYYRYLGSDPDRLIDLPLYAGMTLEAGNVWQDRSQVSAGDMIGGASLFVALDTFLGPVSLSYGYNTDGEDAVYLSIGTLTGPSYRQFDY